VVHSTRAPGPPRRGPPPPLPVTRMAGDLSATLTALETGVRAPGGGAATTEEGWSRATFRLARGGRPTLAWQPAVITLSDATGNRWTPAAAPAVLDGDRQQLAFRCRLWPGEAAWKLRVRFEQTAAFAPDQLWTPPPIELPARRKVNRVNAAVVRQGATLTLLGISGAGVTIPDGCGWDAAR